MGFSNPSEFFNAMKGYKLTDEERSYVEGYFDGSIDTDSRGQVLRWMEKTFGLIKVGLAPDRLILQEKSRRGGEAGREEQRRAQQLQQEKKAAAKKKSQQQQQQQQQQQLLQQQQLQQQQKQQQKQQQQRQEYSEEEWRDWFESQAICAQCSLSAKNYPYCSKTGFPHDTTKAKIVRPYIPTTDGKVYHFFTKVEMPPNEVREIFDPTQ